MQQNLSEWLLHRGSFIDRLKEKGMKDIKIKVINQAWQIPSKDERKILNLTFRHYALIREVMISSDDKDLMWARTIFPVQTLAGKYRILKNLKNRSLGSVLFKDRNVSRSEFEFFSETGRRSVFYWGEKKLLLTEIFLPDLYE